MSSFHEGQYVHFDTGASLSVASNKLSGTLQQELGAFHYAKLTGQRSVGIPEENGTTFSDKTGPTNRNGSSHFKFFFRIP